MLTTKLIVQLLSLIASAVFAGTASSEVVVIVSANAPVTTLSATQVSDIFLGKNANFPSGARLVIAAAGIVVGAAGGYALARLAGSWFQEVQMPGLVVVVGAAAVLLIAALIASVVPAARAARVDVMQALRAE